MNNELLKELKKAYENMVKVNDNLLNLISNGDYSIDSKIANITITIEQGQEKIYELMRELSS